MNGKKVRINRISIRNYKGIDKLDLDFIPPKMPHDPDLHIMGSKNGIGKTSVIECCALLLLSLSDNFADSMFRGMERFSPINIPDLLIKTDSELMEISGDIILNGETLNGVGVSVYRNGKVEKLFKMDKGKILNKDIYELMKSVCGFTPNPVIEDLFLLFHSYRKVQEGNMEFGMMINPEKRGISRGPFARNYDSPMSTFKLKILRALMANANLFEKMGEEKSDKVIEKLNELVKKYVGGKIGKLRPSIDNTVDFRIVPINQDESQTFSFDGLSSGQKEIISTLFLIWENTKDKSSVVFIDEPELHLNSQWHGGFVNSLTKMAPQNQYIMATHSEYLMDCVEEHQRIYISQ